MTKYIAPLLLAFAPLTTPALAAAPGAALPAGAAVRIEGKGIEGGWHEGSVRVLADGCPMIALKKPTREGYTLIALIAVARLQRAQAQSWADVPLAPWLATLPKPCLEEGAD